MSVAKNPKHISLSQKEFLIARQIAKEIEWVLYDKSADAWSIRERVLKNDEVITLAPTWEIKRYGAGKLVSLYVAVRRSEDDAVAASVPRAHLDQPFVNIDIYLDVMLKRQWKYSAILSTIVHEITHIIDPGIPHLKSVPVAKSAEDESAAEYFLSRHEIEAHANSMWLELRDILKEQVEEVKAEAKKQNAVLSIEKLADYFRESVLNGFRKHPERARKVVEAVFGTAGYKAISSDPKVKNKVYGKLYDILIDLTSYESIYELMREKGAGRKRAVK